MAMLESAQQASFFLVKADLGDDHWQNSSDTGMLSPDSTMECVAVKTEPFDPSDYTEQGDQRGLCDIPLKPDPDEPPAEYGSTRLIVADSPPSTLASTSAEVKPWFGDESKDVPTAVQSACTKFLPSPKSAPKRKFHECSGDCTGLTHQIDPVVPQYVADPYDTGDVILNDPIKLDPEIVGTRADSQMIGKSTPSTSAPRRKPSEPPAKSVQINKVPGEKPYACDVCDYRTVQASNLKGHMTAHTGEKPYACGVCDYRTAAASDLKRHMTIHTGEKPFACDVCDYRTRQASTLKVHMATHTGEKSFACGLCDYRAVQSSHLKGHMAIHTGDTPYACDVCGYRAVWPFALQRHMATHTSEKRYTCGLCDYRAAHTNSLKFHMATHTGDKPYACDECGYRTARAGSLKQHVATHTGDKPYACDVCDYRALQASTLKSHMTTHTGEKRYACGVCDYRAAHPSSLKLHMTTHTSKDTVDYNHSAYVDKPHACDVCDYRASRASYLKHHMVIHTGEKPYACDVCDYRATRASYLKRHMVTHNGKEAAEGRSSVPQCRDTGMTSSDTEGTSRAEQLTFGPSHQVDPIVDRHEGDLHELSADVSLKYPLIKSDPDDPSTDDAPTTDSQMSEPLLDHDEVETEWIFQGDAELCDPLEVSADKLPCTRSLQLQLTDPTSIAS